MTVRPTAEVVRAYLDALNGADVEAACALVGVDFHNDHTAALAEGVRGREAYRERLPGFLAAFAGLRYDAEAVIVDGDRAAVPYVMTATVTEAGVAHDVRLRGCFVFAVRAGEIVHRLDYWDSNDYLRQVGRA